MMHEPLFSLLDLAFYTGALLLGWWWCLLDIPSASRHVEKD